MYTYVSYEAHFTNGEPLKVPLAACFGTLTSNNGGSLTRLVKVFYTPTLVPGMALATKYPGSQANYTMFTAAWVEVLNKMFPGDHFSFNPNTTQIIYSKGEATEGQVKLHLFMMRQAYNHPLIWWFLYPARERAKAEAWDGDKWFRMVGFLSKLPYHNEWGVIYDGAASHDVFHIDAGLTTVKKALKGLKEGLHVQTAISCGKEIPDITYPKIAPTGGPNQAFAELYPKIFEKYEKSCET